MSNSFRRTLAYSVVAAGWSFVVCSAGGPATHAQDGPIVQLGVDVLIEQDFEPLTGRRVGLITNPTGVTSDLRPTIDVLHEASNVDLAALFGPEHGVRGEMPAGARVRDARDGHTGLPIYSLYGATRKPTPAMLRHLDVLVFDIQDIGSRSYTFISTMALAMEAAAENGIAFVVLDRPNPLGGLRVEGRPLDLRFQSFVGQLPIAYLHGMTVGELARMINGEGWLGLQAGGAATTETRSAPRCDVTVIPMRGWKREMLWEDTGLHWVPPSPHIPHAETAAYYAATGILGELHVLSEGVGYTLPFELIGGPQINPRRLADELNRRNLAGVFFRPMYFRPYYGRDAETTCGGVQVILTDGRAAELTAIQFHALDAARRLYPQMRLFGRGRDAMFDKVCGTDRVRAMYEQGRPLDEILTFWREGVENFREQRTAYLLYE